MDSSSFGFDAKLLPHSGKIDRHRIVSHLGIEIGQNRDPYGFVAKLKGFFKIPILTYIAASIENAAQRVLQSHFVVCLFANLDIGEEAEERTTPIGAGPSVRVVEAFF